MILHIKDIPCPLHPWYRFRLHHHCHLPPSYFPFPLYFKLSSVPNFFTVPKSILNIINQMTLCFCPQFTTDGHIGSNAHYRPPIPHRWLRTQILVVVLVESVCELVRFVLPLYALKEHMTNNNRHFEILVQILGIFC